MKKFLTILFALMLGSVGVQAQTAYETPKFFDNTYVGVQVGANTPLSFNQVFPLNTTASVRVGKDFTPMLGLNVEGGVWFGSHSNGHTNGYVNHFSYKGFVNAVTVGLNGTVNWSNLISGYKGQPRLFEVSTITGLGWLHEYSYVTPNDDDELYAKTGFDLAFNLGNQKAWQFYIEPAVIWNLTNGKEGETLGSQIDAVHFNKSHAYLQLAIGVNYKFRTSNGTHNFKVWDIAALNNEINNLRAKLAEKPAEVVKTVETVKTVPVASGNYVVYFTKGSSELSDISKSVLNEIPTGSSVKITGAADEVGSASFNQTLSLRRAEAVAKYLSDRNITVDGIEGIGETGNPVARVAIVTVNK